MAVAVLAVFLALGGTALAAHHYLITSTSQIKPSVLAKLRGRVVTEGPVTGPAGPEGKQGPPGAPGSQGPMGPPGPVETSVVKEVFGEHAVLPKKSEKGTFSELEGIEGSFAECPPGTRVVSGGSNIFTGRAGAIAGQLSVPSEERAAWIVIAANGGEEKGVVEAIGFCASDGKAIVAGRPAAGRRARIRAQMRRLLAKVAKRWAS